MTIHIGFTGTRFGMTEAQREAVHFLLCALRPVEAAHHGDCVGADADFHDLVRGWLGPGVRIVTHPGPLTDVAHQAGCVGDERREPKPHMRRNADIVAESTVMIATPYEMTWQELGGTWRTLDMARKKKRPLAIVLPDGTIQRERWSW
jgi:hypothetical protein